MEAYFDRLTRINKETETFRRRTAVSNLYAAVTMRELHKKEELYADLQEFVLPGVGQETYNFNF